MVDHWEFRSPDLFMLLKDTAENFIPYCFVVAVSTCMVLLDSISPADLFLKVFVVICLSRAESFPER